MKRRGFTIIELMMVVGIISVLITVSVTAINGSLKAARKQRAEALCTMVEQSIAAYYAQKDKWPVEPGEPQNGQEYYQYEPKDVQEMIRVVIREIKNDPPNPLIDVSGLFVASEELYNGNPNNAYGMDFLTAIHGSKQHPKTLKLSEMVFGYPAAGNGRFKPFNMTYYPASDKITVTQ